MWQRCTLRRKFVLFSRPEFRSPPFQICSSPQISPGSGKKKAREQARVKICPTRRRRRRRHACEYVCVLARLISSSSYFLAGSAFHQGFPNSLGCEIRSRGSVHLVGALDRGRGQIHNPCASATGLACMRAQSLCVWVNNSQVGLNRDERGRVDEWNGVEWAEKLDVNAIAIVTFFARFTAPN